MSEPSVFAVMIELRIRPPSVCCVMLTENRPELAAAAVRSFRSQTYENKRLLVVSSGTGPLFEQSADLMEPCFIGADAMTIGELRNLGNQSVCELSFPADILIHWDDDDWSHPNRIAEQVALLQSSGADVVGYNRMLFADCRVFGFDSDKMSVVDEDEDSISIGTGNLINTPEAWIYTGEILGTSLAYWRRTWKHTPFAANHVLNEDGGFVSEVRAKGGKVVAVDSIGDEMVDVQVAPAVERKAKGEPDSAATSVENGGQEQGSSSGFNSQRLHQFKPRMIARIHAGNASNPAYNPQQMAAHPAHWKRTPEFASYCRRMCAA